MPRRHATLPLALVVWGCSLWSCAAPAVEGYKAVRRVELDGAREVSERDVLKGLAHHPPRGLLVTEKAPFRRAALGDDVKRVEVYYHRMGYFAVEVGQPQLRENPDSVAIIFPVREGPRYNVEAVELDYANASSTSLPSEIENDLPLEAGAPFELGSFEKTRRQLEARLLNASYYDAKVNGEALVDHETRSVRARFVVQPGKPKRFGPVEIDAPFLPKDSIEERIAWREGEPFSPGAIRISEGRLLELSALGTSSFEIQSDPNTEELPILIRGRPATLNELRLGGGVLVDASNTIARLRGTYTRRQLFGALRTLRIGLSPEFFIETLNVGFTGTINLIQDDALGLARAKLTYELRSDLLQYEGFENLAAGASITFAQPFVRDRLVVSVQPSLVAYRVNITDDGLAQDPIVEEVGLVDSAAAALTGRVSFDARDDPISPTLGYFLSFRTDLGRRLVDFESNFWLVTPQALAYVPLYTSRVVLAARLRFSHNLGQSPLPLPFRVFGGGTGNNRGFARRELSPGVTGTDGDYVPVGGETELLASVELRLRVRRFFDRWLGVVLFSDAGDVALSIDDLELVPPHVAVGTGLRFGTPVGPLRIDLATRLNRLGADEPAPGARWQFHIALGEAF